MNSGKPPAQQSRGANQQKMEHHHRGTGNGLACTCSQRTGDVGQPFRPATMRECAAYLLGREDGLEVGWERGRHDAIEEAAEQRARELLMQQANTFAGWAQREAAQRHGPNWAAMFRREPS